jgi:hypothetical protein
MKKVIFLFIISSMIISCNSKTDLETLKFGDKLLDLDNLEKDYSIYVPLEGIYKVKDINKLQYSNIAIISDSIKFKHEGVGYKNSLNIIVDSYDSNQYLGFELELIDEKTSDKFLDVLMKKYGKPLKEYKYLEKEDKDIDYLWQNKSTNEIILFKKHNENFHISLDGKDNALLSQTRIIIVKDGLSSKPNGNDSRNTPEKIKVLDSNPNAFDIIEIFKNYFPN